MTYDQTLLDPSLALGDGNWTASEDHSNLSGTILLSQDVDAASGPASSALEKSITVCAQL